MIPTSVPTKIAAMIVPTPTLPRLCNTVRQVMADTRTIVQSKPILTLENSICVSSGSGFFFANLVSFTCKERPAQICGKYWRLCTVAVCGDQPAFAISTDGL